MAFAAVFATLSQAQTNVWIQIEAQPSLGKAQERARVYAAQLQEVNGFALRTGWYAIALGPFAPADARDALLQLRVTRQIPNDSYIVDGSLFRRQFWPIGAAAVLTPGSGDTRPGSGDDTARPASPSPAPTVAADETPAQARASERALSREQRELLQTSLRWEGYYRAAIDGAFGPGTRKSMAAWQRAEGFEPTGVLTTAQREMLTARYQQALAALQLTPYSDTVAGIDIDLPLGLVEFDRYEPPFAHFRSRNDSGVRVLLISQTGDRASLRGLYDIMQTLEIVPLEGRRSFDGRSFTLTGENSEIVSHTYAALKDGQVKGFTLVWPAGDEKRRRLALDAMRASFRPVAEAVLPDVYGDPNAAQSIDLLSGLNLRRPTRSRSGFYVDESGAVVTTAQAIQGCERITLDQDQVAQVVAVDDALSLALLRPAEPLAPLRVGDLRLEPPRINAEIAAAGYSYEGALGAPTLSFGTLADLRGLRGETELRRLALNTTAADAGGPVFDGSGAVIGVLLADAQDGSRKLPDAVHFAAGSDAVAQFLQTNGVEFQTASGGGQMAPEDLTSAAADLTVLVSCWN